MINTYVFFDFLQSSAVPHEIRADGNVGTGRRQNRGNFLFNWPEIVRSELDGFDETRVFGESPLQRSLVPDDDGT